MMKTGQQICFMNRNEDYMVFFLMNTSGIAHYIVFKTNT